MPFNSISFVVYFLLFAIAYYNINDSKKILFLILGSWLFYSYENIFNLAFLLSTTLVTYFVASKIRKGVCGKLFLVVGIGLILLQLIFTKYSYAVVDSVPVYISSQDKYFNFYILPIGISFYSLQAIALLLDVNSKRYTGTLQFKEISLFLSFFPQSVSGPIHRANELLPQFRLQNKVQADDIVVGIKIMLWGYFCKLIIADKISILTTPIFNSYFEQDGLSLAIASLLFSLQIYFDFCGYSLIAIGAARILGFTININFNAPYAIASFKEFWHRWHITLSKWMRDYIYIPLGGRRQKNFGLFCLVILTTFLVSGFWHGISLNFILWGLLHAGLYLGEDFVGRKMAKSPFFQTEFFKGPFFGLFNFILFYVLISFTWLIFRTEDLSVLTAVLRKIATFSSWSIVNVGKNYLVSVNAIYILILLVVVPFMQTPLLKRKMETAGSTRFAMLTDSALVCLCVIMIILWGDIGGKEFLYFKF